MQDFFMLC
jgi:chloride channel 3/4/5